MKTIIAGSRTATSAQEPSTLTLETYLEAVRELRSIPRPKRVEVWLSPAVPDVEGALVIPTSITPGMLPDTEEIWIVHADQWPVLEAHLDDHPLAWWDITVWASGGEKVWGQP